MTFATLAIVLCAAGVLVTGALAVAFLRDPAMGMAQTAHQYEKLPEVMTDRYIAFTALTIGATLYGDLKVIAALFAAFAFMGFADAYIYQRGGFPIAKHMAAGAAATIVMIVALLALRTQGGGT